MQNDSVVGSAVQGGCLFSGAAIGGCCLISSDSVDASDIVASDIDKNVTADDDAVENNCVDSGKMNLLDTFRWAFWRLHDHAFWRRHLERVLSRAPVVAETKL